MNRLSFTTALCGVALGAMMQPALANSLEVVGTGDGMELLRAVGKAYSDQYPDRAVSVPPSIGSGGGIAAVGAGKALLARVARPLKDAERAIGLESRSIFRLPTAIYVNQDLAVSGVSYDELLRIYSGDISNWKEVGGPDVRVKVVRREDTDSSLSVLKSSMPGWDSLMITPRSKTAVTTQEAVDIVAKVKGAIGFGPFSRPLEDKVKVLEIEGHYPTDAEYPSAVTISYVWHKSAYPNHVQAFVDYGSSHSVKQLLRQHGAVPSASN